MMMTIITMMMSGTYKNIFVNKNLNSTQRYFLDGIVLISDSCVATTLIDAERCLQNASAVALGPWAEPGGF